MRVVRFAGENVSPSDDGRLYDQIFTNGLFEATTIAPAGGSQINIGPLYGIIRGRDFTAEAQTIDATLPTGSGTATGTIYAEIDISKEEPLSVKTALDPWTATDENINVSGVVAQVKIGTYTANPTAVTAASYVAPSTPPAPVAQFESVKNSINTLGNHLTTAEGNINTNSSDIRDLRGEMATAESNITTTQQAVQGLNSSVNTLANVNAVVGSALKYKGNVQSGNCDDITETGIYYNASTLTTNIPSVNPTYCFMFVINNGNIILQMFVKPGRATTGKHIFFREKSGYPQTWASWVEL